MLLPLVSVIEFVSDSVSELPFARNSAWH